MLRRTLTALVLAAIGLPGIIYGGVFYFVLMTIFLVGARVGIRAHISCGSL